MTKFISNKASNLFIIFTLALFALFTSACGDEGGYIRDDNHAIPGGGGAGGDGGAGGGTTLNPPANTYCGDDVRNGKTCGTYGNGKWACNYNGTALECQGDHPSNPAQSPAPGHYDLKSYNGCLSQSKLSIAYRSKNQPTQFFEGYPYMDATRGNGTRLEISSSATDIAPADVVVSSMSGSLDFKVSESVHWYVFKTVDLEILWAAVHGTTPQEATYYSEAWRQLMLDTFDCSKFARPGATCKLSHAIPGGAIEDNKSSPNAFLEACQRTFVLIAQN